MEALRLSRSHQADVFVQQTSPGTPRMLFSAPPVRQIRTATPHPQGDPPTARQPPPGALLCAGTKLRELQGHGHRTGGAGSGLQAAPGLPRARRTGWAPTEILALLDPRQQLHYPEHLRHLRLPVQGPHEQRCGTNGWSGRCSALRTPRAPGPGRPQPRRSPAPRTLHDVAELAEVTVAPGAIGLYGPVEVELQDPAVHGLLGERRHPGPVGVGFPLLPRRPPRRHPAEIQRAGTDDTDAALRAPRRGFIKPEPRLQLPACAAPAPPGRTGRRLADGRGIAGPGGNGRGKGRCGQGHSRVPGGSGTAPCPSDGTDRGETPTCKC